MTRPMTAHLLRLIDPRREPIRLRVAPALLVPWALLALALPAAAQDADAGGEQTRTLLQFIQAGGIIGYVLMGLSVVGVALIVDGFLRLREARLMPQPLIDSSLDLAQKGRFQELLNLCKNSDTMLGRIIGGALAEGSWGIEAVREGVQQHGEREVTRLRQRNGYIGFIAAVAPMLGLLGTVLGMIRSFQVLGESQGAARPDELAVGISEALVTTCIGLIVAVPMMFFHAYLRDRIVRIGHEAAAVSEKVLRIMAVVIDARQRGAQPPRPPQPAPAQAPPRPAASPSASTAGAPSLRPEGPAAAPRPTP